MSVTQLAALHHTCFVVNDIEKSAETLARLLLVKWNLCIIKPEVCIVHGTPLPFSFRVALAQIGDSSLELISPHTGQSVYVEHLKTKGEGFHHTCLLYPDLRSMQSAKEELLNKGLRMIQHAHTSGALEFAYFKLPEADLIIELLYLKELPTPEMTIG